MDIAANASASFFSAVIFCTFVCIVVNGSIAPTHKDNSYLCSFRFMRLACFHCSRNC
uniref:Uncharacterized protein n=1 Tax=Parascaris univalens TaxID=6257 RepID=A0A915C471_PARUN